ncbi:hypothetical protein RSOLAG22IIIB_07703 [Rhizoctonia solani]|uniref:Tyrosinase copper-binding domain-containing protein n=1 Tax=Rhizoctonia solani TaxID=456999 RepID=A0A0K6FPB5_9AGAM|nr:hypothetical protein RSOLAG22IIIB_07703 [Rhizoctonia solani]
MKLLSSLSTFALYTLFDLVSATNSTQTCTSIEVRKEWRNLTATERKAWIDAVNIAPVTENSTYYDDLVYAHMDLNPIIHFTGLFFPWHRLYVHEWTNALRSECGYKGVAPYWAWEKDAADFENSAMWDTDPESGLGGFGNPDDDYTLKTGGLDLHLAYPMQYRPYPGFGGAANVSANSTFSQEEVDALLSQPEGNFTAFQEYMEKIVGMHSAVHGILGGDLAGLCPKGSSNTSVCPTEGAPTFSANEPMFHMHHGNVDRLWWLWQEKSQVNKAAFHGGSVQNMSALTTYPNGQTPWLNKTSLIPTAGMYESYSIEQVMDTRSWPLCYVYE